MKTRIVIALFAAAGFLLATGANAQTDALKGAGCLNCHDVDKKKVGPSLKDVAKKAPKADEVVAKLKEGKGHPKVAKPEAELKAAVDQALATK
jgi:cytochrome c551/c552